MAHLKLVVIGSLAESLVNFRGDLLRELVSRGHEVVGAAPEGPAWVAETLEAWGVRFAPLPMQRTGSSLRQDLRLYLALRRLFATEKPDAVLGYTIKPVAYGSLAARAAGVRRIGAMITGLGYAFMPAPALGQRVVQAVARRLLGAGLACCDTVFFQNPDDEAEFRRRELLPAAAKVVRINGSGVSVERYAQAPWPDGPLCFLFIGRLIRDKGIGEYIEAAAAVKRAFPQVRCRVVGPLDSNPSSLKASELEAAQAAGAIEYLGALRDVRPVLREAHVLVLPSYREGTPRTVLEAMATGRPALTTDAPGCRETIEPGVSGWLVPPRDAGALSQAMLELCRSPIDELRRAGGQARQRAEDIYDVRKVNQVLIDGWISDREKTA